MSLAVIVHFADFHFDYYSIILHRTKPQVLMLANENGWSLPWFVLLLTIRVFAVNIIRPVNNSTYKIYSLNSLKSPRPHFHSPTYPPHTQHKFPVGQWQRLCQQIKLAEASKYLHFGDKASRNESVDYHQVAN